MRMQTKNVTLRLSESDFTKLKNQVEQSGMNQAEYLRQCILKKKIVSTEGIKIILPEIKRIGNNVNQLARAFNSGYGVSPDEVNRLGEELSEVWRLLKRYLQEQV